MLDQLDNLEVKSFNAKKYLTPPKTGSALLNTSHTDLGEVFVGSDTSSPTTEIIEAEIAGVNDLQSRCK